MSERDTAPQQEAPLHLLRRGEQLTIHARATQATIAVTDRRLVVADEDRVLLDLAFSDIRRVQFDIERGRTGTLVIVPERPADEPRVLDVAPNDLEAVAAALVRIGERLG